MSQGAFKISDAKCHKLEIKPLEREHAAECLRRVLLLENKLEYTKKELLAHEIMN